MRVFHDIESLRRHLAVERSGRRVAFVPTMGALHRGHGACIAVARATPDALVAASIFVNPAQFAPGEDFQKYPRTLDADMEHCAAGTATCCLSRARGMYLSRSVWVETGVRGAARRPFSSRAFSRCGHGGGEVVPYRALRRGCVRTEGCAAGPVIRALVRQLALDIERLARTVREDDGWLSVRVMCTSHHGARAGGDALQGTGRGAFRT
jgi:pantoate--beta-alanine ligase